MKRTRTDDSNLYQCPNTKCLWIGFGRKCTFYNNESNDISAYCPICNNILDLRNDIKDGVKNNKLMIIQGSGIKKEKYKKRLGEICTELGKPFKFISRQELTSDYLDNSADMTRKALENASESFFIDTYDIV